MQYFIVFVTLALLALSFAGCGEDKAAPDSAVDLADEATPTDAPASASPVDAPAEVTP